MQNLTARLAHADQVAADLRDSRCCDALEPCDACRATAREVHAARHAARVDALTVVRRAALPVPPQTRSLRERLARR